MKIAIVTPTYNRKEKTLRFLEALDQQSFRSFELYLVDSGSKDGTVQSAQEKTLGYGLHVLTVGSDKFWSGATNAGVEKALADGAEYIVTLNDDAIIPKDYLERMVALVKEHSIEILTSRIDIWNGCGRIWLLGADFKWGTSKIFYSSNFNKRSFELPIAVSDFEVIEVQAGCGNGTFIKSHIYREIGLYNDELCPHYHGDSEFLLRARSRGFPVFSSTDVRIFNDVSDFIPLSKRRFWDIFFAVGSPYNFKAVSYVVSHYAPQELVRKTLFLYYSKIVASFLLTEKGIRTAKQIYMRYNLLRIAKRFLILCIKASRMILNRIERVVS